MAGHEGAGDGQVLTGGKRGWSFAYQAHHRDVSAASLRLYHLARPGRWNARIVLFFGGPTHGLKGGCDGLLGGSDGVGGGMCSNDFQGTIQGVTKALVMVICYLEFTMVTA